MLNDNTLTALATKVASLETAWSAAIDAGDTPKAHELAASIQHHRRGYSSAAVLAGLDLTVLEAAALADVRTTLDRPTFPA